jgi:mannosyltransferase OCH1-like enzyme
MGGCSRRMVAVALICVGTLLLLMSVPDALRWVSLSKARSEKHPRNTTGLTPTPHAPSPTPTPSPSSMPTPSPSPTPLSAMLDSRPSPPPSPELPVVGFPPQHIEPIRHLYASTRPKVNPEAGFNEKWAEQRELRIAESTSCAESLAAFSRLKELARIHDNVPHSLRRVMCGVVHVLMYGGMHVDASATLHRDLASWFPREARLVLATTADGAYDTRFFAALHGNVCIERIATLMAMRVGAKRRENKAEFMSRWTQARRQNTSHELDSWLFGADVFKSALVECDAAKVVLTYDELHQNVRFHVPPRMPVPTNETQRIPKVIHVVWKTEELTPKAAVLHRGWLVNEPSFVRNIVTDEHCRRLAMEFPDLGKVWDDLELNILRADTCRVLAVQRYGGVYMDLDVEWVRPMDEWLNLTADIVIGHENAEHFCNWFFAAAPQHPCMTKMAETITAGLQPEPRAKMIADNEHFVHELTGPAVFTRVMKDCAQPTLSDKDLVTDKIFHRYGSQSWSHEIKPWTAARAELRKRNEEKRRKKIRDDIRQNASL